MSNRKERGISSELNLDGYSAAAQETASLLGSEGLFAAAINGFQPRFAQQQMAAAVADAVIDGKVLFAEAGTGTGKTWAYLLPAMRHGEKIIISTGTKQLQDQLFWRDLPKVKSTLNIDIEVALLKGRANYLCLHRLETADEGAGLKAEDHAFLAALKTWSWKSEDGDLAAAPSAPKTPGQSGWVHWGRVTSNNENCLSQQCPHWDQCYVVKARQRALEADLVVVNHHLLLADFVLKDEGFGELLPNADVIVVDEAHQLPDIASNFFGVSTSARQIRNLIDDAKREQLELAEQDPTLFRHLSALEQATADFRLSLGDHDVRGVWSQPPDSVMAARDELLGTLNRAKAYLEKIAKRSPGLSNVFERSQALSQSLSLLKSTEQEAASSDEAGDTPASAQLSADTVETYQTGQVHWFETRGRGFALHSTPLEVSTPLSQKVFNQPSAWIFSSATLSVAGDFSHIKQQLGLPNANSISLESPFDYAQNALLYLPKGQLERAGDDATEALLQAVLPVLEAADGGAFLLFTSYRALYYAARQLRQKHGERLLVQGESPPRSLVEQFTQRGDAWLLATQSFWEGVDVPGRALSVVVIDRLPFASPGDPVTAARIEALNRQGNAFMQWQVPQAVISLKQGAGRLIRDINDRGVLVIGDPRLHSKRYGQQFLASLPPMPQTQDVADVNAFFSGQGDIQKVLEA